MRRPVSDRTDIEFVFAINGKNDKNVGELDLPLLVLVLPVPLHVVHVELRDGIMIELLALLLFGLGVVPGLISTVIFAIAAPIGAGESLTTLTPGFVGVPS